MPLLHFTPHAWHLTTYAAILATVVLAILAAPAYLLADFLFGIRPKTMPGRIVDVTHEPARTVLAGEIPISVKDTWLLHVSLPDCMGAMRIEHPPRDWQSKGTCVNTTYRKGRLSGEAYITDLVEA